MKSNKRKSSESLHQTQDNENKNENGNGNRHASYETNVRSSWLHSRKKVKTTTAPNSDSGSHTTDATSTPIPTGISAPADQPSEPAPSISLSMAPSTSLDEDALRGALTGVKVYVMHCKDDLEGKYPGQKIAHVIVEQVRELVERVWLGCEVVGVDQGMRIGEWTFPSSLLQ